ncbi:cyclic pyranopterin phosphate synthase MoaA [Marinomonas sp. 42_23_T18]|nr:cyclic pyranopterin phosphate synthase MoaA [Marinomonas sp. 42_23_T18]
MSESSLVDPFGRRIDYLRISVTDRCDFRCTYCMDEDVTFLAKEHILSLEEIVTTARTFIKMGTKRIRITGGEPLVRKNILWALEQIANTPGLEELTITTNGSMLKKLGQSLYDVGVSRLNVSLDTLIEDEFNRLTRRNKFKQVIEGIETIAALPFNKNKINSVIMKNQNDDQILPLAQFALAHNMDISYIEEMPLGAITAHDRAESYMSSDDVIALLDNHYQLDKSASTTPGPTQYYNVKGEKGRIGVISPHSHNFCSSCNRIRMTVEGRLLLCLGNEHSLDLKPYIRATNDDQLTLEDAIIKALALKPEQHYFNLDEEPQILRFMSATGG